MQSIEMNLQSCSWQTLCQAVIDRFERHQCDHVIRQFFHVKKFGSFSKYVESFDEIVHQLLAHDPHFSTSIITSRFEDGLKPEIKAIVLVNRPKDLDTASSLAILQEEVLVGTSYRENRKMEQTGRSALKMSNNRTSPKNPWLLKKGRLLGALLKSSLEMKENGSSDGI